MSVEVKEYTKIIQHRSIKGTSDIRSGRSMAIGTFAVIISDDYSEGREGSLVYKSSAGISVLDGTTSYYSSGDSLRVRPLQSSDAFTIIVK